MKKLNEFELPFKLLVTGFLIVLSCGFGTAHLYLQFMTEMADGKPGLGLDDITYTYHGNPQNTTFKKKVNGSMKNIFRKSKTTSSSRPKKSPTSKPCWPGTTRARKKKATGIRN